MWIYYIVNVLLNVTTWIWLIYLYYTWLPLPISHAIIVLINCKLILNLIDRELIKCCESGWRILCLVINGFWLINQLCQWCNTWIYLQLYFRSTQEPVFTTNMVNFYFFIYSFDCINIDYCIIPIKRPVRLCKSF